MSNSKLVLQKVSIQDAINRFLEMAECGEASGG
jgi:hypothetical protein